MRRQRTKFTKAKPKWNNKTIVPNFKTCSKATVIKSVWYHQNDRHTGQWNRTQHAESDLHEYSPFTFDKKKKGKSVREKRAFSIHGNGKLQNQSKFGDIPQNI
jgi:hypothetical protein